MLANALGEQSHQSVTGACHELSSKLSERSRQRSCRRLQSLQPVREITGAPVSSNAELREVVVDCDRPTPVLRHRPVLEPTERDSARELKPTERDSARERLGLPAKRVTERSSEGSTAERSTTERSTTARSPKPSPSPRKNGSMNGSMLEVEVEGELPDEEEAEGFKVSLSVVGDDAMYARIHHRSFNVYFTVSVLLNILIIAACQFISIYSWNDSDTDKPKVLTAYDVPGEALKTKYSFRAPRSVQLPR